MRKVSFAHLLLAVVFSTLGMAALASENIDGLYEDNLWRVDRKDEGFTIYTREMPGSNILGFKAEGELNAPVEDVMAHLRDIERSGEWTPDLLYKSTLKEVSDLEAITYSVTSMPWPVLSRDYVLHNKLFLHKERKLLFVISKSIDWEPIPKVGKKRLIRATIGYSNIGIRPAGAGRTYIEWTVFGDPRGSIPTFLVNFFQKKMAVGFFQALEKRSREVKIPLRPGLVQMLRDLDQVLKERP
jgi:hypothetical protein